MYVKSARTNSNSLSGMASRTLFSTCFPSALVRWSAGAVRRFLPLMSILNGCEAPCIPGVGLHWLFWFLLIRLEEGADRLCEMEQFKKLWKANLTVVAADGRL